MRPFDGIPDLERVGALGTPAGLLSTVSGVFSRQAALRRVLPGHPAVLSAASHGVRHPQNTASRGPDTWTVA
jgi:hypothetical protein